MVEVPFDRHRFLLQELIAKQLTSRKVSDRSAVYKKEMVVPFLVDIEVAEALLARLRRTRQGGALLPLTRRKTRVELQVDQLADLGSIINLQEHSMGKVGTCNLRINSGATSYTDMVMVVPPFNIGYRVRKQKGYELITFFYRYSTVVFNGKTGQPSSSRPRRRARGGPRRSARPSLGTPSASSSRDGHPHLSTATCGRRGGIFYPMGSKGWPLQSPTRELTQYPKFRSR